MLLDQPAWCILCWEGCVVMVLRYIHVHQHGPLSYYNVVQQLDIKLHFTGTLTNTVFSVDVEDQDSNLEFPNA